MKINDRVEMEIDALLAHDDTKSVIDAVMSMPHAKVANDTDDRWEKALHARLQARLARRMREVLEGSQADKPSRSAA